jgi:chemotaxis protein MotC
MSAWLRRGIVFALGALGATLAAAQDAPRQPYELVRTLESIQDRIAHGSEEAHRFQRQFIGEIAESLLKTPPEVWQDSRNTRAALIYVLSGGDPRVLAKVAQKPDLPGIPPQLPDGILAYAQGRNRDALALLGKIDPRSLDARLGGHLALAKAMLIAPDDAPRAVALLDDARLLSPGSLVEEAALRRQILLLANIEDYARFEQLSFNYLRRFGKSVYAQAFHRSFAIAAASSRYGRDSRFLRGLEARLDELDEAVRRDVYLAMVEEAVSRGKVELTRMAADKIGHLFTPGSSEAARIQLYKAAALVVVTPDYDYALAALRNIDRSRLAASDARLLDSALSLAIHLRTPPVPAGPPGPLPPQQPASAAQGKADSMAQTSKVLERARLALAKADELIGKGNR